MKTGLREYMHFIFFTLFTFYHLIDIVNSDISQIHITFTVLEIFICKKTNLEPRERKIVSLEFVPILLLDIKPLLATKNFKKTRQIKIIILKNF